MGPQSDSAAHWDDTYARGDGTRSWFQQQPMLSLQMPAVLFRAAGPRYSPDELAASLAHSGTDHPGPRGAYDARWRDSALHRGSFPPPVL